MLRVAVIDDENLARQGLRHLLGAHPELQLIGEADSYGSALELLRRESPDAIFLDIRMPGGTGFELLQALDIMPKVVMVTAYAEHASQAFDIEAVDYLLKPVRPARFAQAVRRLHASFSPALEPPIYTLEDHICLRTPQRTVTARIQDILLLQADGDFTRVFLKSSPPMMICHALRYYEQILPSPPFVRLDRSLITNLHATLSLDRKSRDLATLLIGGISEEVTLGRTAQKRLQEAIAIENPPAHANLLPRNTTPH
jgi:two-component system LytT family response regulator